MKYAQDMTREEAWYAALERWNGNCATCNKKGLLMGSFVKLVSMREYKISGMCPECQASVFGRS